MQRFWVNVELVEGAETAGLAAALERAGAAVLERENRQLFRLELEAEDVDAAAKRAEEVLRAAAPDASWRITSATSAAQGGA